MSMNKSVILVFEAFALDDTANDTFAMVMPHGLYIQDVQFVYSEAITQSCIDIYVVLELTEKSVWVIAKENIGSSLNS